MATTTQRIDTTTADADAYLRKNELKKYSDLKKTVDLCDQALKNATTPTQKKALDRELKARQAAIKKFESVYASALSHGYEKELSSSTFRELVEHMDQEGEKVAGHGTKAQFARNVWHGMTDGKKVNKKAAGIGIALGATVALSAISQMAFKTDLAVGLATTVLPAIANGVGALLSAMFAFSPTFAIASIALTALAVPVITKFIKNKAKQLWADHQNNKAIEQVEKDEDAFEALKQNASKLTEEQINNLSSLSAEQKTELLKARRIQAAQDTKKSKESRAIAKQDPADFKEAELTSQGFTPDEIAAIQAKNAIVNNRTGMETAVDAFNKLNAANVLAEYSDFYDMPPAGSSSTTPKIDFAQFTDQAGNIVSLSDLIYSHNDTWDNGTPEEIAAAKLEIYNEVSKVISDPAELAKYKELLKNVEKVYAASNTLGAELTTTPPKKIADIQSEQAAALETATTDLDYSFGTYLSSPSTDDERAANKKIEKILAEAAKLSDEEKDKLSQEVSEEMFK